MDVSNFISLATQFSRLGSSLIDQANDVLNGEDLEDYNPNALEYIKQFFQKLERAGIDGTEGFIESLEAHIAGRTVKKL